MSLPARRRLICKKGKTFTDLCSLQTGTSCDDLTAWDLTGCTGRIDIRSKTDSSLLLTLTTENDRMILNDPTGYIRLTIDATTTASLAVGVYDFELEITTSDDVVFSPYYGTFRVKNEVNYDAP